MGQRVKGRPGSMLGIHFKLLDKDKKEKLDN